MMFDKCFNILMQLEGGYVNHDFDNGGETKHGISKNSYPNLSIGDLTVAQVKAIYKRDYWDKAKCDLVSYPLSLYYFDCAVLQGVTTAVELLQEYLKVDIDGIVGKKTMFAMQNSIRRDYWEFLGLRAKKISRLSGFSTFGRGWLNRLFKLQQLAHSL